MITDALKELMKEHAMRESPLEACGVVWNGKYYPTRNIEASGSFMCNPEDIPTTDIEEIEWVFHSHTNGNRGFSGSDVKHCNMCRIPYALYCTKTDEFFFMNPETKEEPYVGRVYISGMQDCYTIVQDFYQREFNTTLPHVNRWECWWKDGANLISNKVWEDMGFSVVKNKRELERGDVLVMQSGSKYPDHLAIYLGDEKILHHCHNRLSNIELYVGMWLHNTVYVLRRNECKYQQSSSGGS